MIGTLGDVVFEASSELVRTFDDLQRSGSARWATHEIMAHKPVMEFLGPDVEQISFSIRLDVFLGINPESELQTLREMRDTGTAAQLIINGKPVTENQWVIESLSEKWAHVDNQGRLLVATVDVTLKEYVSPEVQQQWSST